MFAVGAMLFVACEKEDVEEGGAANATIDSRKSQETPVVLGYYDAEKGEIVYNYDLEKARLGIEALLRKEYGKDLVLDKLQIHDSATDKTYKASFVVSYFDLDENVSVLSSFIIDKEFEDNGGVIYMLPTKRTSTVRCISIGCKPGECVEIYDRYGYAFDCTYCPTRIVDGQVVSQCTKEIIEVSETGVDWTVVISEALKAFIHTLGRLR